MKIHDCYLFLVDVLFKYIEYISVLKLFALKSIFYDCDIPDCFWYMPCISFPINSFLRFLCGLILSVSIEQQHIDDYFFFSLHLFPPSLPLFLFFPQTIWVSSFNKQVKFICVCFKSGHTWTYYFVLSLPLFSFCLSYSINMGFCPFFP